MNKRIIILAIIIVVTATMAVIATNKIKGPVSETETSENNTQSLNTGNNEAATVREFTMESFTEFIDGKPKPQFSLKEITV